MTQTLLSSAARDLLDRVGSAALLIAPNAAHWDVVGTNEATGALLDPDRVAPVSAGPLEDSLPRALALAVEESAKTARDVGAPAQGYVPMTPDGGMAFTVIPMVDPPQALVLLRHRRALPTPDKGLGVNLYRTLIETIPHPLFYKDRNGRYLGCNSSFANLMGVAPSRIGEKIIGKRIGDLQPPEISGPNDEADAAILSRSGARAYEATVIDGRGEHRDVLVSKATFTEDDGQVGGIVGMLIDITDRKQAERELLKQATTDMITGTNNRRQFITLAVRELNRSRRYAHPISVAIVDIDFFKTINDTYGHAVGDQALKAISDQCIHALRDTDVFGRIGGEEFAAILPLTDLETARMVGERLRASIEEATIPTTVGPLQVTISVGIVVSDETDNPIIDDLMQQADEALYEAKRGGRNRIVVRSQS